MSARRLARVLVVSALLAVAGGAWAQLPAPFEILKTREPAPDFTLPDLEGRRVGLSGLLGRVVFLNFWATWCLPCREEMPTMEKAHRELGPKGLVVLAVNYREDPAAIRPFLRRHALTFPVLLDDGEVAKRYGLFALPLTYLIDRQGRVAARVVGSRDWSDAESRAVLRRLLEEG